MQITLKSNFQEMARCHSCKLPDGLCICNQLPRVSIPTRIIIIQHNEEKYSLSNTGTLVHRVLSNSDLVPYGQPDLPSLEKASLPWGGETDCAVLFPLPDAKPITQDNFTLAPGRQRTLIVLDATWRKARRMSRRIPGLRKLPFLTFPTDVKPQWKLRKPIEPGQLSTAEAVSWALHFLGHIDAAKKLQEVLSLIGPRILHVRGKVGKNELKEGKLSQWPKNTG